MTYLGCFQAKQNKRLTVWTIASNLNMEALPQNTKHPYGLLRQFYGSATIKF